MIIQYIPWAVRYRASKVEEVNCQQALGEDAQTRGLTYSWKDLLTGGQATESANVDITATAWYFWGEDTDGLAMKVERETYFNRVSDATEELAARFLTAFD